MLFTNIKFTPKVSGVAIVTRKGKVVGEIPMPKSVSTKKKKKKNNVTENDNESGLGDDEEDD